MGDARDVVTGLPADSFDCVVTSPPYYWQRNYAVENQIGLEESVDEYVRKLSDTMDEVRRVLTPGGVLFLVIGDTYYSGKGESQGRDRKSRGRRFGLRAVDRSGGLGMGLRPKSIVGVPWRVAIEMARREWILRSPIVWSRMYCLPEYVTDRPRRSYEYVLMFVKSRRYHFDRRQLLDFGEEDVWTITARPKTTNGLNTAPFPEELVERCLAIGCPPGGAVLDPFAGSGTTLRVALRTRRPATGIDLSPACCEFMVKTLSGT
jgi:DNA modification methylase